MLEIQTEYMFNLVESMLADQRITEEQNFRLKLALMECVILPQGKVIVFDDKMQIDGKYIGHFDEERILALAQHALSDLNIKRENVDYFALSAYSHFVAQTPDLTEYSFSESLRIAILFKLHNLAHFLLDNNLCLKERDPPVDRGTFLHIIVMQKHYDQSLFEKILQREYLINHAIKGGVTALFTAAECDNEFAIRGLLNRPDCKVTGRYSTKRLIAFGITKPSHIALFKEKVQHPTYLITDDTTYLDFPPVWLSKDNNARLLQIVERIKATIPLFQNNAELSQAFDAFLYDPKPLPFKQTHRIAIALDTLICIKSPDSVNQFNTS